MARDLYIVVHGQARHHVEGLVGGWFDSELTQKGHLQAAAVAHRLGDLIGEARPVELHTSDLQRAVQTAEPIGFRLGVAMVRWPELREMSYGEAGGRPQAWLEARRRYAPREGNRLDHRGGLPSAETKREFMTRLYAAMEQILARPAPHQVIVTHGYALTFLVAAWTGMPLEAGGYVNFHATAGGITHLREDDAYFNRTVVRLDDTDHLVGL